jgi:hypothetical protein
MPASTLLDRILWTQLARVVRCSPSEWQPESARARAIRAVLPETVLDPEKSAIVERWYPNRATAASSSVDC